MFKVTQNDLLADKSYCLNIKIYNMSKTIFSCIEATNYVTIKKCGIFKIELAVLSNADSISDGFRVKVGENDVKIGHWTDVYSGMGTKKRIGEKLFWILKDEEICVRYFGDRSMLRDVIIKITNVF